ncbi:hypothetical protein [Sorangium sp. So ce1024]|uniref:hypothetical protein n=1 Tax=Sorangium sp. So ce1024 TaxID=3133327 RepID=UPI003F0E1115
MPGWFVRLSIQPLAGPDRSYAALPVERAVAVARSAFGTDARIGASFWTMTSFGHGVPLTIGCADEKHERRSPDGPLSASSGEHHDLLPRSIDVAVGARSVEVEAAVMSVHVQQDIKDFLVRVCASEHVTTGGCSDLNTWGPPIELAATYHADSFVARDLALSWVHIHEGYKVARAAGNSIDALRARIEAAPRGTRIAIAGTVARARKHAELECVAERERIGLLVRDEPDPRARWRKTIELTEREDALRARGEVLPLGTRVALAGDAELTREQVLAALSMRPATLLEALEASAVPDDTWRAIEPIALETIQAAKEGAPTEDVIVNTGVHTRFIERHAPFHVRRLASGGVLLATHPYRTLWPLWSDALFALGLMS